MPSVRAVTPRIVATDPGELPRPAVDELRARGHDVGVLPGGLAADEAAALAADATVILCGIVAMPATAIDRLRRVRLIMRCGAGVDSVDVDAAARRGIWVANVPDYCLDEVADHTLLLMLAAVRHLQELQDQLQVQGWLDLELPVVRRLRGRTLGLLGFGRVGERVATRAAGFGLRILVHDPFVLPDRLSASGAIAVERDELLAGSDIVSLHAPLTPDTHHLLDHAAFARMRPGAVLVNTSRGGLVDLDALHDALRSGTIAAAGLDVVDGEPHPDLTHPALRHRAVIVTPHVAYYSLDAQLDLGRRVADEVERVLAGGMPTSLIQPLHA
jgi:D-3-phosphoglycerate dehydrogenase